MGSPSSCHSRRHGSSRTGWRPHATHRGPATTRARPDMRPDTRSAPGHPSSATSSCLSPHRDSSGTSSTLAVELRTTSRATAPRWVAWPAVPRPITTRSASISSAAVRISVAGDPMRVEIVTRRPAPSRRSRAASSQPWWPARCRSMCSRAPGSAAHAAARYGISRNVRGSLMTLITWTTANADSGSAATSEETAAPRRVRPRPRGWIARSRGARRVPPHGCARRHTPRPVPGQDRGVPCSGYPRPGCRDAPWQPPAPVPLLPSHAARHRCIGGRSPPIPSRSPACDPAPRPRHRRSKSVWRSGTHLTPGFRFPEAAAGLFV